nr:MAG TPA: hypothetical protein [Caudoviricetes sp.]
MSRTLRREPDIAVRYWKLTQYRCAGTIWTTC